MTRGWLVSRWALMLKYQTTEEKWVFKTQLTAKVPHKRWATPTDLRKRRAPEMWLRECQITTTKPHTPFCPFTLAFTSGCLLVSRNAFPGEFCSHPVKMWLRRGCRASSFPLRPQLNIASNHIHPSATPSPPWLRPSAHVTNLSWSRKSLKSLIFKGLLSKQSKQRSLLN